MGLYRYTWRTFGRELALLLVALCYCLPFYLLFTIAVKSTSAAYLEPLRFPTNPKFGNFPSAWHQAGTKGLGAALLETTELAAGSVAGVILIGGLCAYALARRPGRLSTTLYLLFLLGIIIPFQVGLIPAYVGMRHLGLTGSTFGLILLNIGLFMPLTVFLFTGFIRAMPRYYEEAAQVDGASLTRTFFLVVVPLLRPIIITVALLVAVFVWNEFFIQLIFLSGSQHETVAVALYSFVGEYASQWNFIFAAIVIAIAPIVLFFLTAQKQLMNAFAGGAKG